MTKIIFFVLLLSIHFDDPKKKFSVRRQSFALKNYTNVYRTKTSKIMQNHRLYLVITSTFLSFQMILMIGLFVQLNRSEKIL